MVSACRDQSAIEVFHTDDEDEGELFMTARRMAIPAVERLGTVLIEDVGVPISRVAELVHGISCDRRRERDDDRDHRTCRRRQLPSRWSSSTARPGGNEKGRKGIRRGHGPRNCARWRRHR